MIRICEAISGGVRYERYRYRTDLGQVGLRDEVGRSAPKAVRATAGGRRRLLPRCPDQAFSAKLCCPAFLLAVWMLSRSPLKRTDPVRSSPPQWAPLQLR